jgi:nucleobase:cation symporter-1, NCS1 family
MTNVPDQSLANADLLPTELTARNWRWFHFAALWLGMVISIPAYMLAAGLQEQGMTAGMAVLTILLGNGIVLIPMLLIGHAGARYGIPYAVLVRSAFGTMGARVPAIARAVVACGWFGIQTWVGGSTLFALATVTVGQPVTGPTLPVLGIDGARLACFLGFWFIQLAFVSKGLTLIRKLETWTAPFKIAVCVALLVWAVRNGGGRWIWEPAAHSPAVTGALFWPSLTAMVGFWATMALNIPDFTRFARSQKDQVVGQTIGLPLPMALLATVAVVTTAATRLVFGRAIWDPVELAGNLPSVGVLIGLLIISVDTVSCNIAANLVGPAYDFASVSPRWITYRRGAILTASIGLLIMPWKLIADSEGFIFTWLVGYSALLGPIAGIMIADYWIIRRGKLVVDDLYSTQGEYTFFKGWNPVAFIALAIGIIPNLPGFAAAVSPSIAVAVPEALKACYSYAWFVGAGLSSVVYILGMRATADAWQLDHRYAR